LNHELRRDTLPARPGCNQTAMERDAVEDLDLGSAADDQSLDDIEAVKFLAPVGHLRQIPARRRGRPSDPMPSVQHASPAKDAIDGPLCGQRFDSAGSEGLEDRL